MPSSDSTHPHTLQPPDPSSRPLSFPLNTARAPVVTHPRTPRTSTPDGLNYIAEQTARAGRSHEGLQTASCKAPHPYLIPMVRTRGPRLTSNGFANYFSMNSSREQKNQASHHPRKKTRAPLAPAPRRPRRAHPHNPPPIQPTARPPRRRHSSSTRGINHCPATTTFPMLLIQVSCSLASPVCRARSVLDSHSRRLNRELALPPALTMH
jgi:hypothetical protein